MPGVHTRTYKDGYLRGWYRDARNKRQFFKGTTDAQETLRLAWEQQLQADRIRNGMAPDQPRMSTYGFVDIVEDYLSWGTRQGGRSGRPWGRTHARNRRSQLAWWDEQLYVTTLDKLAFKTREIDQAIQRLSDEDKAPKTIALHVETLRAFCAWCVDRGYLASDPTKHLRRINTAPQTEYRAFTLDEVHRVMAVAPRAHRILYETALFTGLRVDELKKLTLFHLDRERNGLRLDADFTKNRRDGFSLLPSDLVPELAAYADNREALKLYQANYAKAHRTYQSDRVPLLYVPSHTVLALDEDLKRAGLVKETREGILVFHSWRKTFATLLDHVGASAKENQEMMRHATPEITMQRYVKTQEERQRKVLDRMVNYVGSGSPTDPEVQRQVVGDTAIYEENQGDSGDSEKWRRRESKLPPTKTLPRRFPDTNRTLPHQNAIPSADVNP